MNIIKLITQKIGMDGAIAYSSGSRIVGGVTGVATVFFISTCLTGVEQGFYFTFGSILALQIFFELGLTGIMTQYVAYEASHLTLNENKEFIGDYKYRSRLASLLHFCVKWYFILAIIAFFLLLIVGDVYFTKYGDSQENHVNWFYPWILVCLGTSVKLFQSPITSILNGLGYVKEMSKISFWQQIIIPTVTWLGLICGLKLFVIGLGYLLSVLVWFIFIKSDNLIIILIKLWKVKINQRVSYIQEIFPFQWKIALSWISGFFIFQFFNPVLFATEGAIVAGQMGMTLQMLSAIQSLSFSWLNTKIPLYSKLIANREYLKLDSIFSKTMKQMVFVCVLCLSSFVIIVVILKYTKFSFNGNVLGDRFLDILPMLIMIIPVVLTQYTNSWATYLRCHKKEPFLLLSVINGILCVISTLYLGNIYGLYGITIGYCIIQCVLFPFGYIVFKNKQNKWHLC